MTEYFHLIEAKVQLNQVLTVLSIPSVNSMKKKITAQNGAKGIRLIA